MPAPKCLIFGDFLLDLQGKRLWRGAEAVRIGARAFDVLSCLTAAAGQLVSKDTLLETVWPEVMVGEAVVTVAIRELRRALGDTARTPQFIETAHGRGYRFIAPVIVADALLETPHTVAHTLTERLTAPDASALFVGRETELACMREWLMTALQGRRQVGFVAGDPGIGKTTLIDAFTKDLETSADAIWVGYGQCVDHYGIGEAYLPILEALGRLCRRPEGALIVSLLRQHAPSWLAQMPGLLAPAEWERLKSLTSHVTQTGMLRELAEALEVLTQTRPLVLVLEDLHWSDPSTLAFLAYVARRRDPARLLILSAYRPVHIIAQAHPLGEALTELRMHQQCVEIVLDELPETAVATYLRLRFASRRAPHALLHLLHQRCGGNPLFLAALVDELVRQGILQAKAQTLQLAGGLAAVGSMVPESVQQLIAQHVGQLSPPAQALLEAASVAGMTFSVAAVAAGVSRLEASDIDMQLTDWGRQGRFVQPHGAETWPDGTVSARYVFRHALYHDVISRRLSPGRCIHLHRAIGARKEKAYSGQTAVIAAELAVHFEAAQEFRRAVLYRQHAAENALQRSAYEEAIAHLTRGLELLEALPDTPERAQHELILRLTLGTPLSVTRGYAASEVEQIYSRARQLHQQLGDPQQLSPELRRWFQFYLVRGVQFYIVKGDLDTAREVGEQCLNLAGDDTTFRLAAHYALTVCLFYLGEFTLARCHAEQCVSQYDPRRHHALAPLYGYDLRAACLSYTGQALWMLGYPEQAHARCQEALALARELSHPFSEMFILGHLAVLHQFAGNGREASELAQQLIEFCAEKGFTQYMEMGIILRGWGLAIQGDVDNGIAQMRQGLASSGAAGTGLGQAPVMTQLAEACWMAGRANEGLDALEQALTAMDATGESWWGAETYRLYGEFLQLAACECRPAALTSEAYFHQALDLARRQQAKSLELRAAVSLARLWQSQGKCQEAVDLLAPVYAWFTEGFDTADLQDAKRLLEALSRGSTQPGS